MDAIPISTDAKAVKLVKLEYRSDIAGGHTLRLFEECAATVLRMEFAEFGNFMETGSHHVPDPPVEPIRAAGQSELSWDIQQDLFKKESKMIFSEVLDWKRKNKSKAYQMLKNLCSKAVWDNVKLVVASTTPEGVTYAELDLAQDPLVLRNVLRVIARNGPGGIAMSETKYAIKDDFDQLKMGAESCEAFFISFDDRYELAVQMGAIAALSDSELGCLMIRRADPVRFGDLQKGFRDSELNGRNEWPSTLAAAKNRMVMHMQSSKKA